MNDDLCRCPAHDPAEPDSHHTEAEHRKDCTGWPPCGGCWLCIGLQVIYYAKRREQEGTT